VSIRARNDEAPADEATRVLLEQRAARLREIPRSNDPDDPNDQDTQAVEWVAELTVGDERLAIPLAKLRGALPLRFVTPVPLAPAHVLGVLSFQGRNLLAVGLSSLLGGRGWRVDPAVLVVVERSAEWIAFACEQIPRPTALPARLTEEARARSTGAIVDVDLAGARLRLIDPDRFFADPQPGPFGAETRVGR
jgi:purine-binding chemotaxis protein CheW